MYSSVARLSGHVLCLLSFGIGTRWAKRCSSRSNCFESRRRCWELHARPEIPAFPAGGGFVRKTERGWVVGMTYSCPWTCAFSADGAPLKRKALRDSASFDLCIVPRAGSSESSASLIHVSLSYSRITKRSRGPRDHME